MKKALALSVIEGFTLLELLVVIGIISVLIAMGAVSYSTAQKKARDAKRKGDLRVFQNCYEQYYSYNNNFKYPIISASLSTNCGGTTITLPTDPKTGTSYVVTDYDSDGSKYTICSPVVSGTSRLETETCTSGSSCCVSNQQ